MGEIERRVSPITIAITAVCYVVIMIGTAIGQSTGPIPPGLSSMIRSQVTDGGNPAVCSDPATGNSYHALALSPGTATFCGQSATVSGGGLSGTNTAVGVFAVDSNRVGFRSTVATVNVDRWSIPRYIAWDSANSLIFVTGTTRSNTMTWYVADREWLLFRSCPLSAVCCLLSAFCCPVVPRCCDAAMLRCCDGDRPGTPNVVITTGNSVSQDIYQGYLVALDTNLNAKWGWVRPTHRATPRNTPSHHHTTS